MAASIDHISWTVNFHTCFLHSLSTKNTDWIINQRCRMIRQTLEIFQQAQPRCYRMIHRLNQYQPNLSHLHRFNYSQPVLENNDVVAMIKPVQLIVHRLRLLFDTLVRGDG